MPSDKATTGGDVGEAHVVSLGVDEAQRLESLAQLAGGVAFDFNNLLTGILASVEIVSDDLGPNAPQQSSLKMIERTAQKMAQITRQLLAYSGKQTFSPRPVDLVALLLQQQPLLQITVGTRAKIEIEYECQPIDVEVDQGQLMQLLLNLASNAAESILHDRGVVTITAALEPGVGKTKGRVLLSVRDNGAGMTPEVLARAPEPLYSTKTGRRGLGLPAALGIAKQHGTQLRISSEQGRGTMVEVALPQLEESLPPPRATRAERPARAVVLVIDDEPVIRMSLQMLLGRAGYEVLLASDGREGLSMIRTEQRRIDCVLLDLTMPVLDGRKTFEELHRVAPALPVVLMSGYSKEEAESEAFAAPFAGFLSKPIAPRDLINLLDDLRRKSGRPS